MRHFRPEAAKGRGRGETVVIDRIGDRGSRLTYDEFVAGELYGLRQFSAIRRSRLR